jgi:uncharacterized iron-regulated membrane protein
MEVHIPTSASGAIEISINPDDQTYWQADYRYFDQYSLKELSVDHIYGKSENASVADNLMRMNYDIHTGAIIGLPGKILAFLASLVVASLPITGFYIWWGRKQKKKEEAKLSIELHKGKKSPDHLSKKVRRGVKRSEVTVE